ncbi:MAG TPA: tetratricopeptide repeat protein [Solirubrobacter sp.]|nr:tetratricopeptide repeat protein [Solirubrobacter sp.]
MRLLLISLLAFAAGLGVLLARDDSSPAARRVERPVLTGTSSDIPALQRAVRAGRGDLRPALASAYLQRARETADPSFYGRAQGVLRTPRTPEALATAGELALARHDFRGALALGARAGTLGAPVRVDALVELGRYRAAERALQAMVDRKPNLSGYARVSYLRELHGDLAGAAAAMRLAVAAGGPAAENDAYVGALLGELERRRGRPAAARRAFERALVLDPGHPGAEAGLARLDAERAGDPRAGAPASDAAARRGLAAAIARLRPLVARLPLPEYVIALGEDELAAGRRATAKRHFALVAAEQRLLRAAGVDTDVELAIFEADHGDPRRAVALARRGRRAAPSTRAADALGWALTRAGHPRAGYRWARRALRLGSVDPLWRARAGLSAIAAGHRAEGEEHLRIALAHGLDGWPWQAERAKRALR